jgi:hypothetical protein
VLREHGSEVGEDRALATRDIITKLVLLEERSWSVFGKARDAIRDFEVRDLLHPFGLKPEQFRVGGRAAPNRRGYRLSSIEAAVARYIPSPEGAQIGAAPLHRDLNHCAVGGIGAAAPSSEPLRENPAAAPKPEEIPGVEAPCSGAAGISTPSSANSMSEPGNGADAPPSRAPAVGDRVQWVSDGVDQLPGGAIIAWVSSDGAWVRVADSMTGIPVAQVTVLERASRMPVIEPGVVFT